MRRALRVVLLGAVAFVCVTRPMASAGPASCQSSGYSVKHFHRLKVGTASGKEVEFYNWDFHTPTCARSNNIEWPVDLIFWNHAERKPIKAGLFFPFKYGKPFTSVEFARINDGAGSFWAKDQGKKTLATSEFTCDSHYRIYAYAEREYSLQWGYFVIGTTHRDCNEPGVVNFTEPTEYGLSEHSEAEVNKAVEENRKSGEIKWVDEPNAYVTDNEEMGTQHHHIFENDGLASMIYMP
jgi:hypothetical protein